MKIRVLFHSYFRDLTGASEHLEELPNGATVGNLVKLLHTKFPKLKPMERSTLIAVGVDYQGADHILQDGDEVSLFPPVQGG
jgi:molybdopterin converting factor small subunit